MLQLKRSTLLSCVIFASGLSLSCTSVGAGESVPAPDRSFYIYLNNEGGWCALSSRAQFMSEVRSSAASQLEADQAQVWLAGKIPVRVAEFRMDSEGEWSTTSTYELNRRGVVTAVDVIVRSGDPPTDKNHHFDVADGAYTPETPSSFSPKTFRKAVSIAAFPFALLVNRFAGDGQVEKVCVRGDHVRE
jgi:hypothetical protein